MYMLRSLNDHEETSLDELYTKMSPYLTQLSQLAFNGIVNLGPRDVPRLIFDDSDFQKIDLGAERK